MKRKRSEGKEWNERKEHKDIEKSKGGGRKGKGGKQKPFSTNYPTSLLRKEEGTYREREVEGRGKKREGG